MRRIPVTESPAESEKPAPNPDAADLLSVGEFRAIKGTDVLIAALAELHNAKPGVDLAIAGDGEESDNLRAQVARLQLADSIRFLGHTPARQAFAFGRLLVVPSRADSLPYVVIEAGGAGIPMIASDVGGIPEILGPEGNLVPPENPQRLAEAIAEDVSHPVRAKDRAARLRERVREVFSQDAMVEGVLNGYGAALHTKFPANFTNSH